MNLKKIYKLIEKKIDATERLIAEKLASDIPVIPSMGTHIVGSGGKRIRPALLYLCTGALGYQSDEDIKFGVVFEFVHTATLVHDDIIDHADKRRGSTALYRKYGTTLAILFGDHLFNTAMSLAIEKDDFRIVRLINQATAKMIEGEIVQAERNFNSDMSMEAYLDLIQRKTAFVFAATARSAPIIAGADESMEADFFNYGLNIGMAFQLIDDYFDYTASEKALGKPVGSDLLEGKLTYPVLRHLEHQPEWRRRIMDRFKKRDIDAGFLEELIRSMSKSGALDETRQAARRHAADAADCLKVLEPSEYKEALLALPAFVVEREK